MTEEIHHLEKEISTLRERLYRMEKKFLNMQRRYMGRSEQKRLDRLKEELKQSYPGIKFTPTAIAILKLVGTLPYSPSKDKEEITKAIAREYL